MTGNIDRISSSFARHSNQRRICSWEENWSDNGEPHDRGRAETLRPGRKVTHPAIEEKHGTGGTGPTHRVVPGHAVEAGARKIVSDVAYATANYHGVRSRPRSFLYRRTQAACGLNRAQGRAHAFPRYSRAIEHRLPLREPRL